MVVTESGRSNWLAGCLLGKGNEPKTRTLWRHQSLLVVLTFQPAGRPNGRGARGTAINNVTFFSQCGSSNGH